MLGYPGCTVTKMKQSQSQARAIQNLVTDGRESPSLGAIRSRHATVPVLQLVQCLRDLYWVSERDLPAGWKWDVRRHMRGAPTVGVVFTGGRAPVLLTAENLRGAERGLRRVDDASLQALLDFVSERSVRFQIVGDVMLS